MPTTIRPFARRRSDDHRNDRRRSLEGTGRISVAINSLDDPEATPPGKRYGTEGEVSWLKSIHQLPAQRTDEWMKKDTADKIVNNQRSE